MPYSVGILEIILLDPPGHRYCTGFPSTGQRFFEANDLQKVGQPEPELQVARIKVSGCDQHE